MTKLISSITILITIAGLSASGIQEQLDWGKQESISAQCRYYTNFYKVQPLPEVLSTLKSLNCSSAVH